MFFESESSFTHYKSPTTLRLESLRTDLSPRVSIRLDFCDQLILAVFIYSILSLVHFLSYAKITETVDVTMFNTKITHKDKFYFA